MLLVYILNITTATTTSITYIIIIVLQLLTHYLYTTATGIL